MPGKIFSFQIGTTIEKPWVDPIPAPTKVDYNVIPKVVPVYVPEVFKEPIPIYPVDSRIADQPPYVFIEYIVTPFVDPIPDYSIRVVQLSIHFPEIIDGGHF